MIYKHATIIPLIGGMPIAQQLTFNKPPEFVLSYSAFGANDSHYIHWLNEINKYNIPYIVLDEENINPHLNKHVDVICATPPCAGLSSFSVSSSAENKTNDWMYISAKQILEEYRPKVFWGENAPRLFTVKGKPVADELIKIGKENGYSFMMYGTQSRLHGNPQIRPRTFFFFFEGDQVPIFPFIRKEQEMVESILSKGISSDDLMNISINKANPEDDPWVKAAMYFEEVETLFELYNKIPNTTNLIIHAVNKAETFDRLSDYFESHGLDRHVKKTRHMEKKVSENKGYWAHGVTLVKNEIPSLIGAMPFSFIAIDEKTQKSKYLTLRDALRLMKMPEDFILKHENPVSCSNHICQNVPVLTAKDMSDQILNYLNRDLELVTATEVKISNISKTILVNGKPYRQNSSTFSLF